MSILQTRGPRENPAACHLVRAAPLKLHIPQSRIHHTQRAARPGSSSARAPFPPPTRRDAAAASCWIHGGLARSTIPLLVHSQSEIPPYAWLASLGSARHGP